MTARRPVLLAGLLCLSLVGACAQPTPSPTPPPPTPTTAVVPAAVPASPTPPPTLAPSPTGAPTATRAALRRFVVQSDDSKLTLAVSEQLANVALPRDVVMTTSAIAGQLLIDDDGSIGPDSGFSVDLRTLKSDDADRDDDVREQYLETAKFPAGVFAPKEFRNLPRPVPTAGAVRGQLAGDLTLHGVTRPVVFDVDGKLETGSFSGKARTEVTLTGFGIRIPNLAILLRVEDRVRAEIDVVATAR